jgi:hypothetical protein
MMTELQERRNAPRIDCYSRSTLDDSVEHGLVVDMSETGAGLLIPKNTPLFKDLDPDQPVSNFGCLRLTVFHPDDSLENSLNISTNIAWLDHEYSKKNLKIGVHFADMDVDQSGYVAKLIDWIREKENYFLHCELEKC